MERIVLVLVSLWLLVGQFSATDDAEESVVYFLGVDCPRADLNDTDNISFDENINYVLENLSAVSSSRKFYNYTIGDSSEQVYGLYQCAEDGSLQQCSECLKNATEEIIRYCPFAKEAIIWYPGCMLRYANRSIFSLSETSPNLYLDFGIKVPNYNEFAPKLASTMDGLIKNASSTLPHFASGKTELTSEVDNLFSFAQCTADLNISGCKHCLKSALSEMAICCNASTGALVYLPSCFLFYNQGPALEHMLSPTSPPPSPRRPPPAPTIQKGTSKTTSLNTGTIAAITASVSVGLLVLFVVCGICFCRKEPKEASGDIPLTSPFYSGTAKSDVEGLGDSEFEQYSFKTLKIATQDFSDENMLGEGGFGMVYKGIHKNGQELAIKRLSGGTSGQGTKEFMTEARLLAKLQHRNLVKLLGFCSEGDEKLLVYELMPNSSLDGFLFDPAKRPLLDWVTRSKIITGIARGLQYLHEDSRLTIIHRDLKPGNILLDMYMNPKIADFGLAKLSEGAQKFGNTVRVAGTQGYMAPEYLMTGDYSDKTDVYSFGIMLLEIVSGRRNRISRQTPQQEDLSIQAWRLWNEERSFEITDPVLLDNCPNNEVTRYIQIGLLCVQANAEERPTMTAVVFMLTCATDLPLPSTPIMTSNQCNMLMNYSNGQQSDVDRSSTKSITVTADVTHDLNPKPR
ncbi:cysteine-rich receptor-like protein kinase 6 [Silene latifolia]|uniref:cysteine-rich receptor-like protein kinase 6 n=1 Tax=Silene latifolia TaxID=37657 RepID=UPI003D7831A2